MSDPRRAAARGLRRARTRITAITVTCLLVVLVAGAAVILRVYEDDLVGQIDAQLHSATQQVDAFADPAIALPAGVADESRTQYIGTDGTLLFSSPPLGGDGPLWLPGQPTGPHTVESRALGSARIMVTPFRDNWLVFAAPLEPVDHNVEALRTAMLVALPLLLLGFGIVVWLAVGRTLRPVADAAEREEQLLADVSHELRSPLTGIRVLLETEPDGPEAVRLTRLDALAAVNRLQTITDQLVQATRPGRSLSPSARPVDLDDIVMRVARRVAPQVRCRIDTSAVAAGQVVGTENDLESLVDNLLTNATRHASALVRVTVTETGGSVHLTVDDDGPGIAPEDRAKVFERFTRLDEARARDTGGSGLGLAIAKATVEAGGGTIQVDESTLGGARFTVVLPASTDPGAPTTDGVAQARTGSLTATPSSPSTTATTAAEVRPTAVMPPAS